MKRNQSSPASRLALILPRETGKGDRAAWWRGRIASDERFERKGRTLEIASKDRCKSAPAAPHVVGTGSTVVALPQGAHAEQPVFRRQHPIGPYVIDFYCAKAWLAIEIDGMSHDMGDRPYSDAQRDAWLRERGVTGAHRGDRSYAMFG